MSGIFVPNIVKICLLVFKLQLKMSGMLFGGHGVFSICCSLHGNVVICEVFGMVFKTVEVATV